VKKATIGHLIICSVNHNRFGVLNINITTELLIHVTIVQNRFLVASDVNLVAATADKTTLILQEDTTTPILQEE